MELINTDLLDQALRAHLTPEIIGTFHAFGKATEREIQATAPVGETRRLRPSINWVDDSDSDGHWEMIYYGEFVAHGHRIVDALGRVHGSVPPNDFIARGIEQAQVPGADPAIVDAIRQAALAAAAEGP